MLSHNERFVQDNEMKRNKKINNNEKLLQLTCMKRADNKRYIRYRSQNKMWVRSLQNGGSTDELSLLFCVLLYGIWQLYSDENKKHMKWNTWEKAQSESKRERERLLTRWTIIWPIYNLNYGFCFACHLILMCCVFVFSSLILFFSIVNCMSHSVRV